MWLGFAFTVRWFYVLCSIQHVCNFNDVITPRPTHPPGHPNPTCYVASNMCATSTMSLHPTPPTHPTQPTWEGKCIDPTVDSGRSTFRNASLRPTGAENKHIAKSSSQDIRKETPCGRYMQELNASRAPANVLTRQLFPKIESFVLMPILLNYVILFSNVRCKPMRSDQSEMRM